MCTQIRTGIFRSVLILVQTVWKSYKQTHIEWSFWSLAAILKKKKLGKKNGNNKILNSCILKFLNESCSWTQRSDDGSARTHGPKFSSQALYLWATALIFTKTEHVCIVTPRKQQQHVLCWPYETISAYQLTSYWKPTVGHGLSGIWLSFMNSSFLAFSAIDRGYSLEWISSEIWGTQNYVCKWYKYCYKEPFFISRLAKAKFQFSSWSLQLSRLVWISLCRKPQRQVLFRRGPIDIGIQNLVCGHTLG